MNVVHYETHHTSHADVVSFKVKPLGEDDPEPTCLAGSAPGNTKPGTVPSDSVWNRVYRATRLPEHTDTPSFQKEATSNEYLKIMNGTLMGVFTLVFTTYTDGEAQPYPKVYLTVDLLSEIPGKEGETIIKASIWVQSDPNPEGPNPMEYTGWSNDSLDTEYENVLTDSEKQKMGKTVLHYIIRAFACELTFTLVDGIVTALTKFYFSKRMYHQALDALSIKGDAAFCLNASPIAIGMAMIKVGESLAGFNYHLEAANLYAEALETYLYTLHMFPVICHYAGLAYRRANKYGLSEKYLIMGWNR